MSDPILDILQKYKTLAVVGLSSKPSRPSHGVAAFMKGHGYRIIPVNPNEDSVFGEKVHPTLDDVAEALEIVVIFRRSEFVPEVVQAAIRKHAKVVWMQEGVVNEEAAASARAAGLFVVQNRCILKEYAKRFVTDGI